MKGRLFLAVFLLISFTFTTLSSLAYKSPPGLEYEGFNLSKPILQETRNQEDEGRSENKVGKQMDLFDSKKVKGKGVYGGGNVAHRPRPNKRSEASCPATRPFLLVIISSTATLLHLSFSFILNPPRP